MTDEVDDTPTPSDFLLYQTEDGGTRIECRLADETLWLTQAQIAALFQTTPQNITGHLKAIYAEGELSEGATCKSYLQVRSEGNRSVSRETKHYRLEAILAVGFHCARRRSLRRWEVAGASHADARVTDGSGFDLGSGLRMGRSHAQL